MKTTVIMPENTEATPFYPGFFEYRNPKLPHENLIVYIANTPVEGGVVMSLGPENTTNFVGEVLLNISLHSSKYWYKLPPGTKIEIEI